MSPCSVTRTYALVAAAHKRRATIEARNARDCIAGTMVAKRTRGERVFDVRFDFGRSVDRKIWRQPLRDDGESVREDQHADDYEQSARRHLDRVIVPADSGKRREEAVDGE